MTTTLNTHGLTNNLPIVDIILNLSTIQGAFNLFCADKSIRQTLYLTLPTILRNTCNIEILTEDNYKNQLYYRPHHFIIDMVNINEILLASYSRYIMEHDDHLDPYFNYKCESTYYNNNNQTYSYSSDDEYNECNEYCEREYDCDEYSYDESVEDNTIIEFSSDEERDEEQYNKNYNEHEEIYIKNYDNNEEIYTKQYNENEDQHNKNCDENKAQYTKNCITNKTRYTIFCNINEHQQNETIYTKNYYDNETQYSKNYSNNEYKYTTNQDNIEKQYNKNCKHIEKEYNKHYNDNESQHDQAHNQNHSDHELQHTQVYSQNYENEYRINTLNELYSTKMRCIFNSVMTSTFDSNVSLFPKIYRLFISEKHNWEPFQTNIKQYLKTYGLYDCSILLQNFVQNKNIFMLTMFCHNQDTNRYKNIPSIVTLIKQGTKIINTRLRKHRFGSIIKDIPTPKIYNDIDIELSPRTREKNNADHNKSYFDYKNILDQELDEYMKNR